VQGSSQALFRIFFGISGILIFNGLILGTTIALLNVSVFLFFSIKGTSFIVHEECRFSKIRGLVAKYKKFALYDAPSSILSFAAFNLPTLILAYYFGKKDIGCFSMVLQLLLIPMSLVGSAMGRVFYQEICKENSVTFTQQATRRMVKTLGFISILPLLFLVCGGDHILVWLLGSKWQDAGIVALSLALWSFPTILTQPLLPLFRYSGKQDIMLLYDILYFIFGVGSIYVCCQLRLSLISVLIVFSISCFLVKMLLFIQLFLIGKVRIRLIAKYIPIWSTAIAGLVARLMLT
jgi:O-antigen/teichoic acid export membrane protein